MSALLTSRIFLCITLTGLVYTHLLGQRPNSILIRDSLITELRNAISDTSRINILILLSGIYADSRSQTEQDRGLQYAYDAYNQSKELKYAKGIFFSLQAIAGYYDLRNDYQNALEYLEQSLEIANEHGLYEEMHRANYGILNLHFHLGDYTQAMNIAMKGLKAADEMHDEEKLAHYTSLMGFIALRQGNLANARTYYIRYLMKTQNSGDSALIAEAFEYMSDLTLAEGNLDSALYYRLNAVRLFQSEFRNGRALLKRFRIVNNLTELGRLYHLKGDNDNALRHCLQALAPYDFGVNDYEIARCQIVTGNIFSALDKFHKADSIFRQGLTLSRKIKHAENTRDAYHGLYRLFNRLKMYDSALHYLEQYTILKDSIVNERSRKEIKRIESEYNLQMKDQEIAQKHREAETQKLITFVTIAAFTTLLVIIYLLYNRHQLRQRNKFQEHLNQKQNELFNTITSIQDKERKRVAQDIHDQVGSVLSAAKLQLSGLDELKYQLGPAQVQKYSSAMALMDRATEELRNISHNLMPATLSRLGLVAALRGLFEKISEYSGLQIHFNAHGFEKRLDEPIELNIYSMVLELINNVVKHAKATEATVQLVRYPQHINISVEDNGKGFNLTRIKENKNGVGMQSLISRINFLKGSIHIDSAEGRGTTVMVEVPCS
ncbi:histidine kinase [Oscillatoria amoena NRMC-F 0135]|nr:histidine kinase [Oscillatoria amoena NRMC-F 0135]